jgi:hypothetical protein
MARAGKGMGNEKTEGHQGAGASVEPGTSRSDFAQEIQGKNRLQGNDQSNVRNERGAMPEETDETEGVIESFENMDPRRRAGK